MESPPLEASKDRLGCGLPGMISISPARQQIRLSEVRNSSPTPLFSASMVRKDKNFLYTDDFSSGRTSAAQSFSGATQMLAHSKSANFAPSCRCLHNLITLQA